MELKEAWDGTTLGIGSAKMDNGEHATAFRLSEIWDRLQEHDCNDSGPTSLAKFLNWAGSHPNSPDVFSRLQDQLLRKDAKWNSWFAG